MNIIINYADGSVTEHMGLADHIDLESHVEGFGFEVFHDVRIPRGDYGHGEKICCRQEDEEYEDGDYDVAEVIEEEEEE